MILALQTSMSNKINVIDSFRDSFPTFASFKTCYVIELKKIHLNIHTRCRTPKTRHFVITYMYRLLYDANYFKAKVVPKH